MKRKTKSRAIAAVLGITTAAGVFSSGFGADELKADAASRVDLNYLMEMFPDGKYWNHMGMSENNPDGWTDIPCQHSLVPSARGYYYVSNGTCNYFGGCSQCWGFVDRLAYECYGTMYHTLWPKTTLDNLKPGDAIRFQYDMHSAFITGVDGEKVTYGDCNNNFSDCKIRWNVETTKSEIAKSLVAVYSAPEELTVNLTNRSYIDTEELKFGSRINAKGAAAGGAGHYQYEFAVQKPKEKSYTVIQKYGDFEYCSYFPWADGKYNLRVNVKDKDGKVEGKVFPFTVKADKLQNRSSLKKNTLTYGEKAEFTFGAAGGTNGYQYSVSAVKPSGKTVTLRNYGYGKGYSYYPWETGKYTITVKVRDASGKTASKNFNFTVKAPELKNNSTVDKTSVVYSKDIGFNFRSAGGTGGYQYHIDMIKPSSRKWITLKNYNTAARFVYHPWEQGNYKFRITVRDRMGKTSVIEKVVTVKTTPIRNLSVIEKNVVYGKVSVMTFSASGGSMNYRFKIEAYKPESKKWATLRDFSYARKYKYHPWEIGQYVIRVTVKDSFGKTAAAKYSMKVAK